MTLPTDCFWIVSEADGDDFDIVDEDGVERVAGLQLVEFRRLYRDAREVRDRRVAAGESVSIYDDLGEMLWSNHAEPWWLDRGKVMPCMSPPKRAGLYRWHEVAGHTWVAPPPLAGFRRTPPALTDQRTGTP